MFLFGVHNWGRLILSLGLGGTFSRSSRYGLGSGTGLVARGTFPIDIGLVGLDNPWGRWIPLPTHLPQMILPYVNDVHGFTFTSTPDLIT